MKKNDFIIMLGWISSGFLFAIGMCMVLLPEWGVELQGAILGGVGIISALAVFLAKRKMAGKALWIWNTRIVVISLFGFVSAIVFGLGMVMTMVWGMMTLGIILGFVGVLMLAALLLMVKGFEE
ncbi:hypothetical protein ACI78P_04190 [Leuconostoc mesenteroides]|uniref:hypothetical protein n=1 Tax=Leuconostoc mesenteroides TaxID=1245 RepID=UPI00385CAECB